MKVYALYYKEDFIVAYEYREDCIDFGKIHYAGCEWDCSIVERWLHETKQYPLSQPLTQPVPYTPYTPPIPLKTTPYAPNIWYEVKGPKGVFTPGTK